MIETAATTAGQVVNARPWRAGVELSAERGIVVGDYGHQDEYVLVWFPGRNSGHVIIGHSVQPILRVKIEGARPLAELPKTWVRNAYRLARQANRAGAWDVSVPGFAAAGLAIEGAARALRKQD